MKKGPSPLAGYQVLDQRHEDEISYTAPLPKPFMGATMGEERKAEIGGKEALYRVVRIEFHVEAADFSTRSAP